MRKIIAFILSMMAMGVWAEKSMYGRKYFGTVRTTFIINEESIIENILQGKQIKTKTHGEQLLTKPLQ